MGEPVLPLVEPDLVGIWRKNVWWFGLRWPFSMVLFSWVTVASTLAPEFHLDRYLLTLLAGFFGLVIGAHYIDITASKDKYLPYFPKMNRRAIRTVGVLAVLAGMAVGVYMSITYSLWFLVFVILGGFFALLYPIEKPKWLHTYPGFGLAWGFMPVLASYYIQGTRIDLLGLGLAVYQERPAAVEDSPDSSLLDRTNTTDIATCGYVLRSLAKSFHGHSKENGRTQRLKLERY